MAQGNPYYGVPNQRGSVYEEQNYYGVQSLPYGSAPQSMNYNNFIVPNNVYSNFGTNLTGNVYNVHELEAQQFASYIQNTNPTSSSFNHDSANITTTNNKLKNVKTGAQLAADQSVSNSKLTATAAEFKPSASCSEINSETYYRNYNNEETRVNTGAVRKYKDSTESKNIRASEESYTSVTPISDEPGRSYTQSNNSVKSENRRSYNKKNVPVQNYSNDSRKSYSQNYSNEKSRPKQDRNNYNKHFKKDELTSNDVDDKFNNQRQSDYNVTKFDNKYNRYENRENSYSRNFRRHEFNRENGGEPRADFTVKPNNRQNMYSYSKTDTRFGKYDNNKDGNYNRNYRDNPERSNVDGNSYSRDNKFKPNSYRNNRYDKVYENWRSNSTTNQPETKRDISTEKRDTIEKSKSYVKVKKPQKDVKPYKKFPDDDISQRDRLTEQVNRGNLECLVCCERVRQADKIWHCQKCFHIFHFRCITKWSSTSKDDNGWRCPACQHVYNEIPSNSFCYCGKVNDPQFMPGDTAHSCGENCGRLGIKPGCIHRCNLLCHPGPCPKCESMISKNCNCGATSQTVKCIAETVLVCSSVCNKILKCGVHYCEKICHGSDCDECVETIHQDCYCGKLDHTVACSKEQKDVKQYSCKQICDKPLLCANHNCKEVCHPGECPPCIRAPAHVKTCPCGKSKLEVVRTSCLDPIPCCGKVCGKRYPMCGTPAAPHICKEDCHEGDCPPCKMSSFVRCRCGHMNCEISCVELISRTDDARCEKKCTKKRSCARHKCNQLCCIDIDHICPLPCNHMLTCGLHRCEKTCHNGRCPPCWRISFEELYCECGVSVSYPPVPCGAKRPICNQPCTREHNCKHETLHTCHSQPECPPCTVLTAKLCYGGHEKRTTIPCHQKEFSCGLQCGKELSCGRHKCQLACHKEPCLKERQSCAQPCTVTREACGHPCGMPCHEKPCPESPCRESVKVTCECGLRSSSRVCMDMANEYQRIATSILATKMADMQLGHSIDIADIIGSTARKQTLKTLECNDECRLVERNRRLAIGLQIRNPDLSAKLTPRYSDFMRLCAKKDQSFCLMVHDKLTELVQLAKQSKQKSRSFSFPSMNREKRQFVHEYCEHFGCDSAAYDQEPNRNVVATAAKEKAWLPSCSLLELIQRESGQRKVPGPILNRPLGVSKISDTVSLKISATSKPSTISSTSYSSSLQQPKAPEAENIDYFNFSAVNK